MNDRAPAAGRASDAVQACMLPTPASASRHTSSQSTADAWEQQGHLPCLICGLTPQSPIYRPASGHRKVSPAGPAPPWSKCRQRTRCPGSAGCGTPAGVRLQLGHAGQAACAPAARLRAGRAAGSPAAGHACVRVHVRIRYLRIWGFIDAVNAA